jgi:hypothetical protein
VSTVIEDLKVLEERILTRIAELEASVSELEQLREVAARLGILDGAPRGEQPTTPKATASVQTPRRPPVRRRPRASGTRATPGGARSATGPAATLPAAAQSTRRERVLEVVGVAPGISVREIVTQLGVNRTSLYPVVRALLSDGLLYKDGTGLWPVSSR